jgi:uncharacterized protein
MQLTFHLTKGCNLRCRYCYYTDFSPVHMHAETALRATEQVLALGHTHLGVTFFGGEPLLCKDMIRSLVPEIQHRCQAAGATANFKIPTNGLLLDDDFIQFCEEHAVFISLSIDGDEQAQRERVRADGQDSFVAVRRALERLVEQATTFATYSVVTPHNVGSLAGSIRNLYAWGSRILITALDYSGAWTRRDLDTLEKQYRDLADFYVTETLARQHFYLSPFDAKILAHTRPDSGADAACHAGINRLSVAPDGSYFPCVQFVERPEFAVGHVSTGIDAEKCRNLFGCSLPSQESCTGCGINSRCTQGCACVRLQTTGSLHHFPPVLCEHERLLTPIADAVARKLYRRRAPVFVNKNYNPEYNLLRTVEDLVHKNLKESSL